ncbi:MAG: dihydrofolate reductase family protein, partial [Patescibacteria group bacterium]
MTEIRQIEPEERPVSLEGMYLSHSLQELAKRIDRPIVVANYVTDLNDVIAVEGVRGAPEKLKNPSDWRLFQELTAQADVIITGTSYISKFSQKGESGQNVLTQFDKGSAFEGLGDWREQNSLGRNPDLVVVSRSLSFSIPKTISERGRKIFIFTTDSMQDSEKAQGLKKAGATVIGAGKEGVDGAVMVERLGQEGYKVIKLTTGPRVLKILMDAEFKNQEGEVIRKGALDRLYITKVDRKITDDLLSAIT